MTRRQAFAHLSIIPLSAAFGACGTKLERAGAQYKKLRDYRNLTIIFENLETGMAREQVEKMIGIPDVTPEDGQAYYPSDRTEPRDIAPGLREEVSVGLMIDYRDLETGKVTPKVQRFRLGPVGGR